jgi:predicted ATPase
MSTQITHLHLENWRNFRSVDIPLGARAFVVGPNASGKTNLLDAIRFLSEIARPEGSLARAVNTSRGGIAHLRSLHARQASDVRIQLTMVIDADTWVYELCLGGTKSRPVFVVKERVEKNGKVLFSRPNAQDKEDVRLLEQTHLEQLSQNARFRGLVDALAGISLVHVVPQIAKSALRSEELVLRDAAGSDFIDQLSRLPDKKQRGLLNRIEKLLKIAVPHFSQLRARRDEEGRPHLEANYEHWRGNGSWQNESEFSDGTLRLIGFLWAILSGTSPLLLEEPELSLHREVVRQLPRVLARAGLHSGRQVIVSTHSEEMLNDTGIDPKDVIVLTPTAEETQVATASEDPVLVDASRARVPMGPLLTGKTRPDGIEQLAFASTNPSSGPART